MNRTKIEPSRRRAATRPGRRLRPDLSGWSSRLENRTLLSTVTVNTTTDSVDYAANVTVGGLGGTISLRDAVEAATNTAGATTIVLPIGTYNLSHASVLPSGQTYGGDDVPSGTDELLIGNMAGQAVTIEAASGLTASNVIINQMVAGYRIFTPDPAQRGNIALNLSNLTLEGASKVTELFGGGVVLAGGPFPANGQPLNSLTVANCAFPNDSTLGREAARSVSAGVAACRFRTRPSPTTSPRRLRTAAGWAGRSITITTRRAP